MRSDDLEQRLVEKLRRIEALFSGAKTAGERSAAAGARERILELLRGVQATERPIEYRFTLSDQWSRRLFVSLLRRYDLRPYRYPRQRHTTVMARVPASFVETTLWPEFVELDRTLREYLSDVTDRVIAGSIHADHSEAEVVEQPTLAGLDLSASSG
jgi:spore cortex formation protein SpoVR/YcgB (stage V sporulation)